MKVSFPRTAIARSAQRNIRNSETFPVLSRIRNVAPFSTSLMMPSYSFIAFLKTSAYDAASVLSFRSLSKSMARGERSSWTRWVFLSTLSFSFVALTGRTALCPSVAVFILFSIFFVLRSSSQCWRRQLDQRRPRYLSDPSQPRCGHSHTKRRLSPPQGTRIRQKVQADDETSLYMLLY